ncbi:twitching motility protein PilT, partial [Pseudomonas syringae pv. actinidiae]|nr:twitching motility protein PilT [Pseudomonas syringae pv. actinidiae]
SDLYLGPDFTDVKGWMARADVIEAPENWKKAPCYYGRNDAKHFEVHQDT